MAKSKRKRLSPPIERFIYSIMREQGYSGEHIKLQIEYWNNCKDDVICIYDINENVYLPVQLSMF